MDLVWYDLNGTPEKVGGIPKFGEAFTTGAFNGRNVTYVMLFVTLKTSCSAI